MGIKIMGKLFQSGNGAGFMEKKAFDVGHME